MSSLAGKGNVFTKARKVCLLSDSEDVLEHALNESDRESTDVVKLWTYSKQQKRLLLQPMKLECQLLRALQWKKDLHLKMPFH